MTENDYRSLLRSAELPALRDIFGDRATLAEEELRVATRRYEQTVDRREKLRERTRFGLLALNAASLAALLASSGSQWDTRFQLSDSDFAEVMLMFLIGLILSAISIWFSGIILMRDSVTEYEELMEIRGKKAKFDRPAVERNVAAAVNRQAPKWKVPPDYRRLWVDDTLISASGSGWLAAVAMIAWNVGGYVDWNGYYLIRVFQSIGSS